MNITFLGQGFEPESKNSIGNYLMTFLSQQGFHTFTGISAFASEAGIAGLAKYFEIAKANFEKLSLIVGIDQEGTSKEALHEIDNLQINSYIFYQQEAPIFHPKIYLFEGNEEIKLIIGSSNLTARGLFCNVESSLLVEFSSHDDEGNRLLTELKNYYQSLFDYTDPNLFKISEEIIQEFIDKGIVPNESIRNKKHGKQSSEDTKTSDKSGFKIPKRSTAKIPSNFRPKLKKSKQVVKIIEELEIIEENEILLKDLIWKKLALSQSDAQHVPSGTAITANLKLSQARFKINDSFIDQKTYFRNQVFGNLNWVNTKPGNYSYEEVFCQFNITILGKNYGVLSLKLSHDPVRIADQGNTPTWLHWGENLLPHLRDINVTGKIFKLYSTVNDNVFSIVIE